MRKSTIPLTIFAQITVFLSSIKSKVLITGILLVAAAIGLVTTLLYHHAESSLLTLQSHQHVAMASRLAAEYDHDLTTLRDALTRIAQSIPEKELNNPTRLSEILNDRPALRALFPGGVVVVDSQGNSLAEVPVGTGRVGTNVASRDWFQQVSSDRRTVIGEPYRGGATKRPLFVIAAPLGNGSSFAGAIAATVYLDANNTFSQTFHADVTAEHDHRRLWMASRQSHVVVASSNPAEVMQPAPDIGNNALADPQLSGHEGATVTVGTHGIEELAASKSLTVVPWVVFVATATSTVLSPIHDLLTQTLLWGILSAFLAAIVLWIVISRILAPVHRASEIVHRQLEASTLGTAPFPEGGNDEIGVLLQGFNYLYAKVQTTSRQLNSILDNSTVGITFVQGRKQLWANRQMGEMFGYTTEEMLGKSTRMFYPSDESFEAFGEEGYLLLAQGKRFLKELPMQCKDGTTQWMRVSGKQVDASDLGAGSIWVLEDISDRRAAEAALRESEASLRTIADYTFDWESWQSPEGSFVYVSPSCADVTGFTAEEIMTDPELVLRIIHPDDQHLYASHLRNIEHQGLCEVEFRILTKVGDIRWIAHGCRPVIGSDGSYLGRRASNRDVTAAKEAELQYRTILQTAQDGYRIVARDTHFIDANDAYCRMLGYHRDELLALTVADVDVEEDQDEVQRHTEEMRRNGHAPFETRHRCKDGTIIDVEVTVQHLELYGGVLITFIRDISERKLIERQLADERRRFKDFSASTADWFWEMDAQLRFCYFSDNFEKVYGLKPEVVLGKSRPELLAKDQLNPQAILDAHRALLEQHQPFRDFEYRIRDSAGNIRWMSISGIPVNDRVGNFAGYRGVGQVVTERKIADVQLREAKERLEIAAFAGVVGVWDWDVVNNRLIWDKVMYQLYGLREEGWGGTYEAWAKTIHPDDKAHTEGETQAALRGEREYCPEFRVVWPDGSIHHLKAMSRTTFDGKGKPLRMVGVNYDVTEQKNVEMMLEEGIATRTKELKKARDAAQAASVAKSAFLANMSHEMRTPLHQIQGMAQLIRREPLTPKQTDRVEKLESVTRNLTAIIDTVLDLTKFEADKFDLVLKPFSPEELLNKVLASVQAQATTKHLQLVSAIDNVPALLLGDRGRLGQALLNYASNAIRFTEAGTVSIRLKLDAEFGEQVRIRCEVEDSGPGIDPQDLARLFSIFEQVDNSSTRRYGGLGTGLAMTRKIAEIMGGEAGCDSRPGAGSTFWFTVRLKKA